MVKIASSKKSKPLLWAVMAVMVLAMAGFGIGDVLLGTSRTTLATVGDAKVSANDYYRALNQQVQAVSQQIGQPLTIQDARNFGLDIVVLNRLVFQAALDNQAAQHGISVGDEAVRRRVQSDPAFRGNSGTFDSEAYRFVLANAGLRARDYETQVRADLTRDLLAATISRSAADTGPAAQAIATWLAESRDLDIVTLTPEILAAPLPEPDESDLREWYDANPDTYTRPETRRVSYAGITPMDLAAGISIPEDEIQAEYDARLASYETPERRIVDRLIFADMANAEAARQRLDSGEATFDVLVAERGLDADRVSMGMITAAQVSGATRSALFGQPDTGLLGPVETDLGPVIFRINAILAASTPTLEDVREELVSALTLDQAARRIADNVNEIDDMVAAGFSIEELGTDTLLIAGEVVLAEAPTTGVVADPAFVAEALAAAPGQERDLIRTREGGLFVLRVEEILPPELSPYDQVRDAVLADWQNNLRMDWLREMANEVQAGAEADGSLAALAQLRSLPLESHAGSTRANPARSLPQALATDIFDHDTGAVLVHPDGNRIVIVQITGAQAADTSDEATARLLSAIADSYQSSLDGDLLTYFGIAAQGVGVDIDQALLAAILQQSERGMAP